MKLKSLLLGSVAAAGLSTGAYAADLNVLTSLDVCDQLGISGLTISSDSNCLQITGGVSYEFAWGNFNLATQTAAMLGGTWSSVRLPGGAAGTELDWWSSVDAFLKFVGTAPSDVGRASAVIKLDYDYDYYLVNEVTVTNPNVYAGGSVFSGAGQAYPDGRLRVEEAYVTVGDQTVLMAGQKGSIARSNNDSPLTWLDLYNSEVGAAGPNNGVETAFTDRADGGPSHVIQVISSLGDGWSVGAGLENLNGVNGSTTNPVFPNGTGADDGTLVGYVAYSGNGISAHLTGMAGGILDATVDFWGMHAGIEASIDMFKFVAALAADSSGEYNWLASASADFDIFTLAVAGEWTSGPRNTPAAADQWGASVSGTAAVTDAVTINLGFRWFDQNVTTANSEIWQAAAALAFAATESITIIGEVGVHGTTMAVANPNVVYGAAEVKWAPGGGFETSLKGEVNSVSAYKITYKASKNFQ